MLIKQNTANLQNILETINNLPSSSETGGGMSVETCTVNITWEGSVLRIAYTKYENDEIISVCDIPSGVNGYTCNNVIKGSVMVVTKLIDTEITFDNVTLINNQEAMMDGFNINFYQVN